MNTVSLAVRRPLTQLSLSKAPHPSLAQGWVWRVSSGTTEAGQPWCQGHSLVHLLVALFVNGCNYHDRRLETWTSAELLSFCSCFFTCILASLLSLSGPLKEESLQAVQTCPSVRLQRTGHLLRTVIYKAYQRSTLFLIFIFILDKCRSCQVGRQLNGSIQYQVQNMILSC